MKVNRGPARTDADMGDPTVDISDTDEEPAVDSVNLEVPFMVLSTKETGAGETEKRFFTPFGSIDVTLRRRAGMEGHRHRLEIVVGGDAEYWACQDHVMREFRAALAGLVWGMVSRERPCRELPVDPDEVRFYVRASETDLIPFGDAVFHGRDACNGS